MTFSLALRFLLLTICSFLLGLLVYFALAALFLPDYGSQWIQGSGLIYFNIPLFAISITPIFNYQTTKEMFVSKANSWPALGYMLYFGLTWGVGMLTFTLVIKYGTDRELHDSWPVLIILFLSGLAGGCLYGWDHRRIFRSAGANLKLGTRQ